MFAVIRVEERPNQEVTNARRRSPSRAWIAVVGLGQHHAVPPHEVEPDRGPVIRCRDEQVQEAPEARVLGADPVEMRRALGQSPRRVGADVDAERPGSDHPGLLVGGRDRAGVAHLAAHHDRGEPAGAPVIRSEEREGEDVRLHRMGAHAGARTLPGAPGACAHGCSPSGRGEGVDSDAWAHVGAAAVAGAVRLARRRLVAAQVEASLCQARRSATGMCRPAWRSPGPQGGREEAQEPVLAGGQSAGGPGAPGLAG